jgi:hypothetical protein
MPEKRTIERARKDRREGKSGSTQAGEFVREEIHHIREGKHGAKSPEQAIAIGLSKARRAGVNLPPPKPGRTSEKTRRSAERAYEVGQGMRSPRSPSKRRSRAITKALRREGHSAVSRGALARHAHTAAGRHTAGERSAAARRAVRTKGPAAMREAGRKAARTRKRHGR